jgi:hypothetical protein
MLWKVMEFGFGGYYKRAQWVGQGPYGKRLLVEMKVSMNDYVFYE